MSLILAGVTPSLAWQFESSNIDYITNLSPSGGTFTPTSLQVAPTYTLGKYAQAIYFDNSNSGSLSTDPANCFVTYALSPILSASSMTVCFWIKAYSTIPVSNTKVQYFLSFSDSSISYLFGLSGAINTSQFVFNISTGLPNILSGSTIQTGTWYHVALVLSSSGQTGQNTSCTLYFNGSFVSGPTTLTRSGTPGSITNLYLGSTFNTTRGGWCALDDLRMYKSVLNASQILSIYNQQGAYLPIQFSNKQGAGPIQFRTSVYSNITRPTVYSYSSQVFYTCSW